MPGLAICRYVAHDLAAISDKQDENDVKVHYTGLIKHNDLAMVECNSLKVHHWSGLIKFGKEVVARWATSGAELVARKVKHSWYA